VKFKKLKIGHLCGLECRLDGGEISTKKMNFNVQKCACHGAPFLAYLHEHGGHKIMYFLMPLLWSMLY